MNIRLILILMTTLGGCQLDSGHQPLNSSGKSLVFLAHRDLHRKQGASFDIVRDILPKNRFVVDTTHSSVHFRVRHWGIYDLIGRLESYEMVVHYDKDNFSDMVVEARLRPASITMPNQAMADHLVQEGLGFFEVSEYPEIIFKSTKFKSLGVNNFKLFGRMIINQIEREVDFDVTLNGYAYPPEKATPGFTIQGMINRQDFQLGGTDLLPGNKLPMIGNEVYLTSNVRLIRNYD